MGHKWTAKDAEKQKTRISTGLEAGFWLFQDFLRHGIGGIGGLEPPTPAL
jgi:hypothetical protein